MLYKESIGFGTTVFLQFPVAGLEAQLSDSCRAGSQIRRQLQAAQPEMARSPTVWACDLAKVYNSRNLGARFVDSCRPRSQIRRQLHVWKPDSTTVAQFAGHKRKQ